LFCCFVKTGACEAGSAPGGKAFVQSRDQTPLQIDIELLGFSRLNLELNNECARSLHFVL